MKKTEEMKKNNENSEVWVYVLLILKRQNVLVELLLLPLAKKSSVFESTQTEGSGLNVDLWRIILTCLAGRRDNIGLLKCEIIHS